MESSIPVTGILDGLTVPVPVTIVGVQSLSPWNGPTAGLVIVTVLPMAIASNTVKNGQEELGSSSIPPSTYNT